MRSLIVAVAGPRLDTDTRETWLIRAAGLAGVSVRQTRALYYGEIIDPDCGAVRKFEVAAERKFFAGAADLAQRFESMVVQLQQGAAFLDRGEVDALHRVANKLRNVYGAQPQPEQQSGRTE